MNDHGNSNGQSLRDILQSQIDCLQDDPHLAADLVAELSAVRALIVGGRRAGHVWPAATIRVRRLGAVLEMTAAISCLEVECRWIGTSFFGLLEAVNEDVQQNTVAWQPDYKGRQRLEARYRS